MAETTPVAQRAAPLPDPADIARAEAFTGERYVHDGEDPQVALAPGSPRRRALDAALAELDAGATVPSTEWRRRYALLLGLERLLSEDEPRLADGTLLNPHQVDALSGTLTALLAEAQRESNGNGSQNGQVAAPVLAVDEEPAAVGGAEVDGAGDVDADEEDEETAAEEEPDEREWEDDLVDEDVDEDVTGEAPDDPNAFKRFWFEHATGAGKTVAALGFVEASRTGGVLILTHRRNLVDQFNDELTQRGYANRICKPLLDGEDRADGPVTVETYQWFVRNAGSISPAYTIVICDEAHTALGEKTSSAIRAWTGPVFIGMTATGALIARHVTDLFPTQTSRFDLAQAARRGVIAPLRCVRIPPGPGVRTIAKVPLRRGEVDTEFDQELLAELLDQLPFNLAVANLYKTRFDGVPGVVYAAGVRHAYNVAEAFRDEGMKAEAVSGETPKRELAEILARYERGEIDVLVNAQLLAEGWNSPRATVCMHLAPTASKRIYQQRVGRVTRRHPGKEAGIVVDFVHPATKHDDPVVTLHSLLDRDVYRGGAIVVGPVRRGRGRRVRVERRVLPVVADENRRIEVFERELWRIAVEHLDYGEQIQWAALAGARVAPSGWRRARAMLHFDRSGELKRTFLLTAVQRNRNSQLRIRALQEIAAIKDAEAFDLAIDEIGRWSRDERREGAKVMLQALAEKRIGRRDQATAWIWRLAEFTREVHEEYAVQRWPETKRLLGLLVNSSGGAHARNARRLVHAARKQDRRLAAALLAAALAHTPEAEEVLRGARTRMARKPSALSRELLRNFPKRGGKSRGNRRRKKKGVGEVGAAEAQGVEVVETLVTTEGAEPDVEEVAEALSEAADAETPEAAEPETPEAAEPETPEAAEPALSVAAETSDVDVVEAVQAAAAELASARAGGGGRDEAAEEEKPKRRSRSRKAATEEQPEDAAPEAAATEGSAEEPEGEPQEPAKKPARRRTRKAQPAAETAPGEAEQPAAEMPPGEAEQPAAEEPPAEAEQPATETELGEAEQPAAEEEKPKRRRRTTKAAAEPAQEQLSLDADADAEEAPKPKRRRTTKKAAVAEDPAESVAGDGGEAEEAPKPKRRRTTKKAAVVEEPAEGQAGEPVALAAAQATEESETPKPKARRRTTRAKKAEPEPESEAVEADEQQPAA